MHRNALSFKELRIKDHTSAVLMADFRMQRFMTEHCHPVFVCVCLVFVLKFWEVTQCLLR